MRGFPNKRLALFITAALALFIVGCNTAREPATTPETDALLRAARSGNADTVKTLLTSSNVDVNAADADGNTALIEAARFGHDDVVTALLIARANVNVKNKQGKTALQLASEGGHDETVRLLTQAGPSR
ncbi:MAG TPA: ankyrin repeat domain-containing protein [Pyrinomonadaceae bacterium]|nr:ankyrin repeat domain-containing protein [Pyrinomonadaceae bacterium]